MNTQITIQNMLNSGKTKNECYLYNNLCTFNSNLELNNLQSITLYNENYNLISNF